MSFEDIVFMGFSIDLCLVIGIIIVICGIITIAIGETVPGVIFIIAGAAIIGYPYVDEWLRNNPICMGCSI